MIRRVLAALIATFAVFTPAAAITVAAPAAQIVALTQDRITLVDLAASRLSISRVTTPGDARKVVSAGSFIFLQRRQAVDILDVRTLQRLHLVEWAEEVRDIAASGSLLLVAVASDVHVLRLGGGGQTTAVRSFHLPKPVDALTAVGARAYALDDLRTPLYMHRIDLSRLESARVDTMPWAETNAHLRAQAVDDRWYVLIAYTTISERGQYIMMLPTTTPLRELGHRTLVKERRPPPASGPVPHFVEEFRVFRGVLFGISQGDDHFWLVRRNLGPETGDTQRAADLGAVGAASPFDRRGAIELIGSRLYLGGAGALLGFDLDPARLPTRVVNIAMPSPVVSIALQTPGR